WPIALKIAESGMMVVDYRGAVGRPSRPGPAPRASSSPSPTQGGLDMTTAALTPSAGRLHVSERVEERVQRGELTPAQVDDFRQFLADVDRDLMHHRIVVDNRYTRWFRDGVANDDELKHFIKQFSVFSNQFLVAALLKVINAPSLQQMRASKEILLNELGVIYRKPGAASGNGSHLSEADKDREGDPDLVGTEGTVD